MGSTKAGGWIAGTAFLVVVIFVATWFLLAAPRFESASATMVTVADTKNRNQILAAENAKLKADFENLDGYKAELAALQTQIPTRAQISDYTRAVESLAATHGVFIVEVAPGVPQIVTLPTPPAPEVETPTAAAPTEGEAASEPDTSPDAEAPAPAAPAAPVQIEGFVAVPVVVKVLGPYANVSAFLAAMQATPRSYLVVTLEGLRQGDAEAAQGKPATVAGDVEITVSGFMYVLSPPATPIIQAAEGEEPVEAPLPGSDRNPFAPVAGSVAASANGN